MLVRSSFSALLAAFLCGCSSDDFKTGHGDAGQFILQQALVHGAHPVATNGLPAIDVQWRYSVDKDGAVIQLPRDQFAEVQVFLRQAFGSPEEPEPVDRSDGGKMDWYPAKIIGIGILYYYDPKHTIVTVLRPQPMSKVMEFIMSAPQEKK